MEEAPAAAGGDGGGGGRSICARSAADSVGGDPGGSAELPRATCWLLTELLVRAGEGTPVERGGGEHRVEDDVADDVSPSCAARSL